MDKITQKRIKNKINPIIGALDGYARQKALDADRLEDSVIPTEDLIKATNKFLEIFNEEFALRDKQLREAIEKLMDDPRIIRSPERKLCYEDGLFDVLSLLKEGVQNEYPLKGGEYEK